MQLSYISTVVAPCADAVIAGLCPFRVSFFGDQVCLCHRPGCPIFLSDLWTGCHWTRYAGRGWNGLSHVEQLSFLTHRASLEVISAFWDVVDWCHRQEGNGLATGTPAGWSLHPKNGFNVRMPSPKKIRWSWKSGSSIGPSVSHEKPIGDIDPTGGSW